MPPFRYTMALRVWGDFDASPLMELAGGDTAVIHKALPSSGGVVATAEMVSVDEDYFYQRFVSNGEDDIEDTLYDVCRSLEELRGAGWSLARSSRAELFVSLSGPANFGFTVKEDLLSRLGELGLALAFDINPAAGR